MKERYFPQPSVNSAQQHFSQVPSAEIQRSRFDRSHGHKTAFNAGVLIPIFVDEVLPGDTFDLSTTAFCRLATPLKPFMDNVYLDIHYFFVPYRLTWDHWENFMGERDSPDDDPSMYSIPQASFNLDTLDWWHLANYMGLPKRVGVVTPVSVSALPFRAYKLIYNEWYRDQNLIDPLPVSLGDGPDVIDGAACEFRCKRHDYFTSALPWPQKGDPVYVPLGLDAPVVPVGPGAKPIFADPSLQLQWLRMSAGAPTVTWDKNSVQTGDAIWGEDTGLMADLTAATAITINDLRTAFQIQRLLERDARGGTRYVELVLSHFGVRSDDSRVQRPEYLGGGTTRLNVNPVASTAAVTDVPQGNLSGVASVVGRGGFSKSFTEHGVVIGIASARADLTYQQGVERFWSRKTRYDFYWPALAHLGEQAILNKEIFVQGSAVDDQVFGYQERYAEYRYKLSRITSQMSSEWPTSLDVWHLSQDFADLPLLNESFIQERPPIDRVIAVTTEPEFLCDIWFDFKCDRPMPVYSVPGLIDHF